MWQMKDADIVNGMLGCESPPSTAGKLDPNYLAPWKLAIIIVFAVGVPVVGAFVWYFKPTSRRARKHARRAKEDATNSLRGKQVDESDAVTTTSDQDTWRASEVEI